MRFLQEFFLWFALLLLLTGLLPGLAATMLARSRHWSMERTRTISRWLAGDLAVCWWFIAVYLLHMHSPYDWIGATIGTPVRVLAFTAWCLSPGYLAPYMAAKIYGAVGNKPSTAL